MEFTAEQIKARFVQMTDAVTGAAIYFAAEVVAVVLEASGNAAALAVFKDGRSFSLKETTDEYFTEMARCMNEISRQNLALAQDKWAGFGAKKSESQ